MRSKSGFSFFSKMTSSRKRPSLSLPSKSHESTDVNKTIDNAAEIIEKWNTEYVSDKKFYSLFCESKRDAKKFVKRVKELQNAMDLLIREDPNSEKLLRAQNLMQIAMKRLQKEFLQILSMNRAHLDPESISSRSPTSVVSNDDDVWHESRSAGDSIIEVEEVSKNSRTELKSIADCMIAAGCAKECATTYKSIRKSIVDESIYRLGVENISSSKAKKMPCEVVELKMNRWIEAVKVSMKTLFNGEKTLCDEIFESSVSLREFCFRDISKEGALLLFGFPETITLRDKKNPHPEKIFPLLDMYCTITDNLLAIEAIFSFPSISNVRTQAHSSLSRLSESILAHLMDFESQIRKDSSKTVVRGGGVHPMTISAMNHISRLAEYSNALINILKGSSSSSSAKALLPKSYFNVSESEESPVSELKARFAWMILVLLCKIDGKAEMYKDFSMQYLFLANNLQHVVSRARSTNVKHVLGNDWIAKNSEKVRQFARSYERLAWGPLASMCPAISTSEAVEMSPEEAMMQFKKFNETFESTCEDSFRDQNMERSQSLDPMLKQAIRDSRIALVVFSKNYASSSWCLNELLEIVKCKEEFGQMVIPIFYCLDPSHVRHQDGDFGKNFEETCGRNTEEEKIQWEKALTDVANLAGFDSVTWDDEAKMIEEIANDVSGKLLSTSSTDSAENSIGIEDHIANMSVLLQLEAEEVRMVGIWGSSGIGKTTIARALFNQLSRHFPVSKFIDRAFVYKSRETYKGANPDDPNMKLHLQGCFLSEILGKKDIKIDHLGALGERLKHQKTLIIIDDLDDLVVLDSLVGKTNWFGCGSRIIVITNNKQFLRAHGIDHIYEVSLPSKERAQEMFCQSAFGENSPPEGFEELVVEIAWLAGSLPLGLTVFGSALRGRKKEYWVKMLPRLQNDLDGNIEETLKVSYDAIGNVKDQALFRLIACLFNHVKVRDIELLLADSGLDVNIALENLVDKSLIHVRNDHVEMHRLLQETGRNIVRSQSTDNPGEREFLVDSNDSRTVLSEGIGTRKVLGISLDTSKVSEFCVHENAFKGMGNLLFLDISSKTFIEEEVKVHLPEKINYYSVQPKQLIWDRFPLKCMPYTFLRNLVKLEMHDSKLEKLWEGAMSFTCLKELDMWASKYLKEIPDLSKATNIEKLDFGHCWSLVELPSSIRNLNKLLELNMEYCGELETLPTGFNLKSLDYLNFNECWKLRTFPEFATNISNLILAETSIEEYPSNLYFKNVRELSMGKADSDENKCQGVKPFMPMLSPTLTLLELWNIPNLVELSSSFQNLNNLERLDICYCRNLESLPTGINLESLVSLNLFGCSRLKRFPDISTNIKYLDLDQTGIEEVPWQIENFFNLTKLTMKGCRELKCVSLNIFKLKHLGEVSFSNCGALTRVDLSCYPSGVEMMKADNADIVSEETTSSLPDSCVLNVNFMDCVNLDREPVLHQQSIIFNSMILPGEEVPSYFTYRTSDSQPFGTSSSLPIPLLPTQLSQPFFRFRVCAVVSASNGVYIGVYSRFKGRIGNKFDSFGELHKFMEIEKGIHLCIFDCRIRLYKDNVPLSQLNYDHVDINIHITSGDWRSTVVLKEWGIRLLEDCSSAENRLGNPNSTLPHVCVEDEENLVNGTEQGDRGDVVTETSSKQNEDVILLQRSADSMFSRMSGKEMISYFTHRTTGTSLTNIPLPHTSPSQPFFRFKAFAVVGCKSSGQFSYFVTHISCRFKDGFENQPRRLYKAENGNHLDIYECSFPLYQGNASPAEMNYDRVDIQLHLRYRSDSTVRLIVWGIRLIEDCSSSENQLGYLNTL